LRLVLAGGATGDCDDGLGGGYGLSGGGGRGVTLDLAFETADYPNVRECQKDVR